MCNETRAIVDNGRYEDITLANEDEHAIRLEQGDAFVVINRKRVAELVAALVKTAMAKRPPNP